MKNMDLLRGLPAILALEGELDPQFPDVGKRCSQRLRRTRGRCHRLRRGIPTRAHLLVGLAPESQ